MISYRLFKNFSSQNMVFKFLVLMASSAFIQCQETQLRGSNTPPKQPPPVEEPVKEEPEKEIQKMPEPLNMVLSCADESKSRLLLPKDILTRKATLDIASSCFKSGELDSGYEEQELAIMLSLDISTSMLLTLDTIKENIVSLVEKLQKNGYKLKIGAVGFVDEVLDGTGGKPKFFIKPTGGEAFNKAIKGWKVQNLKNVDMQEAGFDGIAETLKMMNWVKNTDQVAILHISDAISFADGNHDDFSVDSLASKLKNFKTMEGFQFFYSAPEELGTLGFADDIEEAPFSPAEQLRILATKAEINSKAKPLPFPFTEETLLTDFAEGLIKLPPKEVKYTCNLSGAELLGPGDKMLKKLDGKRKVDFDYYIETYGKSELSLQVKRCCKLSSAQACESEVKSIVFQ